MDNNDFILALHHIGAIKLGCFTLKSSQNSPIYINLRQIISYPDVLQTVASLLWQKIKACRFDLLCGVPYTALPIATCISIQQNIPMIMVRKEKKDYGTKQKVEGVFHSGQGCLIIEDVITTGSSIIETATDIENEGLTVTDLAVLIDREQGGRKNLEQKNYAVHAVFTLTDILKCLVRSNHLTASERRAIDQIMNKRT